MNTELIDLQLSFKNLTQNLINRIDPICVDIECGTGNERLTFWLEDLSVLTESILILCESGTVQFDIDLFNEKALILLDKVEEKDFLYVSDLLKYEMKPLLTYWDGCITND